MLEAALSGDEERIVHMLDGARPVEHWTHFPEALKWMNDHISEFPTEEGWWTYFIIHRDDHKLIGTAGFKGPPDKGMLEIGYEIANSYQGQGLATEAAKQLIIFGMEKGINQFRAHTLAERNASTSILKKLGMELHSEKVDLEDGTIWEWRLTIPK